MSNAYGYYSQNALKKIALLGEAFEVRWVV
jgi:hypothetical protein